MSVDMSDTPTAASSVRSDPNHRPQWSLLTELREIHTGLTLQIGRLYETKLCHLHIVVCFDRYGNPVRVSQKTAS